MKKRKVYSHKKSIRIVSSVVAFMLIIASLLILCNCSNNEKEENASSVGSVVSTNSQTQTSTEPVRPERVVEIYSFKYGSLRNGRLHIRTAA